MRILVIDDDKTLGELLQTRISSSGYEVFVAADAVQGVQQAHRFKPDLIILDLMLPAGGGLRVLKNLKASMHTSRISVLIITGTARRDFWGELKEVREIGVDGCLLKPFHTAELLSTVQEILSDSNRLDKPAGSAERSSHHGDQENSDRR